MPLLRNDGSQWSVHIRLGCAEQRGCDLGWTIEGFGKNLAAISFFVIGTLRIADNLIANAIISCYKSANIVFIGPDVTGKNRG